MALRAEALLFAMCCVLWLSANVAAALDDFVQEPNWPIAGVRGVSFSDVNADGWVDAVGKIPVDFNFGLGYWQNAFGVFHAGCNAALFDSGSGADIIPINLFYGQSLGDRDNDGYPDCALEPRANDCFYSLIGTGEPFDPYDEDQCTDGPFVFRWTTCNNPPCLESGIDAETAYWADADMNGLPDLFLPAYRSDPNDHGNYYFHSLEDCEPDNKVLVAPGDLDAVGIRNVVGAGNPEGAQWNDYDQDGDLDLFVFHDDPSGDPDKVGCIHQNITPSAASEARFQLLTDDVAGFTSKFDEGRALADLDQDGDFDLVELQWSGSAAIVRAYPNRGDGSFGSPQVLVPNDPNNATRVWGLSIADADLDGALDITRAGKLYRNPWTGPTDGDAFATNFGEPAFVFEDSGNWLISWADIDRDGDLDAAVSPYADTSTLADAWRSDRITGQTAQSHRRFIKIRPVKEVPPHGPGDWRIYSENEFGAVAEVVVLGDESGIRRRQFAASSHGYLNQNEYILTFGLPAHPDPNISPAAPDLTVSLSVDFPCDPNHDDPDHRGPTRVDGTINPVLDNIQLHDIYGTYREFTVFRDGKVIRPGDPNDPPPDPNLPLSGEDARLFLAAGPLVHPGPGASIGSMIDANDPNDPNDHAFVALRFAHMKDSGNIRIRESSLTVNSPPRTKTARTLRWSGSSSLSNSRRCRRSCTA